MLENLGKIQLLNWTFISQVFYVCVSVCVCVRARLPAYYCLFIGTDTNLLI